MAALRSIPGSLGRPTANAFTGPDEGSFVRRLDKDARELLELDDPFEAEDALAARTQSLTESLIARFVAHLRARKVDEMFVPAFEAEARAFRSRFHRASTETIDGSMLQLYVEEGRLQSLGERALRNRAVAGKAFLDFLAAERRPASPPARPAPPPPPVRLAPPARPVAVPSLASNPGEKRRHARVAFLADVRVEHYGVHRSADISVGGIYLEKLTIVERGDTVRLVFKLRSSDAESVVARARVCFVHPQFGAGLDFVELSPSDAKRISDYVTQNR